MKKICIFSANYFPNIGGIERYTYYIAKGLTSREYAVTIVTSDVHHCGIYEKTEEGFEIYRLPCYNTIGDRYPIYKKNKTFKEIDAALRAAKFDFIMINARFYFHSLYGAALAKSENIPCITIEHGTTHLSVDNPVFDKLGEIWEHSITKILKKRCKHYYGVSQAACDWSGHFGIVSEGTLYNAIDLKEIEALLADPVCDYKEKLEIPDGAVMIVYTGRLLPIKGVMELNKAFKKMNHPNAYLIYAGDGPMYEELMQQKNHHTFLLGRIDFPHVVALLKTADIFCLPSVSEGLSTSVMEAVAAHTFIITTKTGGTKELISGRDYGIIMDNNSPDEIYEALKQVINDPDYRRNAIQNSYKKLCEQFTFDSTVEKLIQVIENTTI